MIAAGVNAKVLSSTGATQPISIARDRYGHAE
jgi:hypothetical protein